MPLFLGRDSKWTFNDDLVVTELTPGQLAERMQKLSLLTDGMFQFGDNIQPIKLKDFEKLHEQAAKDLNKIAPTDDEP